MVRTQLSGTYLKELATVIKQLAYWTLVGLPSHHIQREEAYTSSMG
jgi:hypothetical protein